MTDSTGLRFIGIYPDIPLDGEFILRDLPGSGKRIDVLCRSLSACFDWASSPQIRSNLEFIAVLSNSLNLRFSPPQNAALKGETWWASIIQNALRKNPPTCVKIEEMSLENTLMREENLYVLDEGGQPISSVFMTISASPYSFMFGNHHGFDERTSELIHNLEIHRVSLGRMSYLGSHCVAAILSHFERMRK